MSNEMYCAPAGTIILSVLFAKRAWPSKRGEVAPTCCGHAERHDADGCGCPHEHQHEHMHGERHAHETHAAHAHGISCAAAAGAPEAVDFAALDAPSATRAVYRIMNMDCPMEEALIRKKLGTVPGITGLKFNLMQRVLTVDHELPSTEGIEAALREIDMTPEPVASGEGAVAIFSIGGMDCPTRKG